MTDSLLLIARIGAAHGIKGEVRVKPFAEDPLALGDYGALQAKDGRRFKITRLRPQKSMLVVKFKGVNSRDEAEALNGLDLFIPRDRLPDDTEEDEFYVADLVGLNAVDTDGSKVGTILNVPDFGAGDLLEIAPASGGASYYLEFTHANVPRVDLENGTVTVSLPEEVSERDGDDGKSDGTD